MTAKYQRVAERLTRGIQAGAFQPGERLPGEVDLARSFDVSRSTIRQALSSLQHAGLIETWSGAGSFVCYNGARIDDGLGWSRALARHGVEVQARILRFERVEDVPLAETLALPSAGFLALDRVRSTQEGKPISLERSRLPWRLEFATVLATGLVEGSLRRTLESLDIKPIGGTEAVDLIRLSAEDARELRQPEGEPFLGTTRVAHDLTGSVVEHVRSLLHPAHFTLQLSFGDPPAMSAESRALGALLGLAIGDALGMPTQYQPRALIAARYGILDWFQPGPDDNFISRGMAAGRVTDDTDQAVLLGEMLVQGGGRIEPERFAQALLAWEARMIAAGSLDLLGPSTRQALKLVAEGASTDVTGRSGSTNGAAMRVAPVGIAFPTAPLSGLVDAVFQTGHVTHNTTIAIAGASAVAAAVSAGIEGASLREALALAIEAARLGGQRGFYFAGGEVAARTEWALELVKGRSEEDALDLIYRAVGTGVATNEAVPAAIAVCAVAPEDPWRVCCLAASLGGDCDTVGAIAGSIMGACHGAERFPADAVAALLAANPELKLEALAADLLALRAGAAR